LRYVCILHRPYEDLDHAWRLTCQDDVSTASGAAAFLLMTPEHQDIEAMAITAEKARDVSELRIMLDVLTSAEHRDLANALLRAAWSAVLEETRIVLLDLLLEGDDAMPADVG
jgi:hypothetical protein